jgi:hypothetical protein
MNWRKIKIMKNGYVSIEILHPDRLFHVPHIRPLHFQLFQHFRYDSRMPYIYEVFGTQPCFKKYGTSYDSKVNKL